MVRKDWNKGGENGIREHKDRRKKKKEKRRRKKEGKVERERAVQTLPLSNSPNSPFTPSLFTRASP
jgi:hypothetical protein